MFTLKELADIESWRNQRSPTKRECKQMQTYKQRITKTKEKRNCFCSKADRNKYKSEFYKFWDEQNIQTAS